MQAIIDVAVLEERLAALEAARAWSPRVVSRLESRIGTAEDLALFRVNPLAFASEAVVEEAEAVDLFLHATHVGLFEMEWNIVCLSCGNTARSFRGLAKVDAHFECSLCQAEAEASLDDYIQVSFTISPSVRPIVYHEPGSLSAEDLIFRWHFSHDISPTLSGRRYPELLREWTRLVRYLEPHEEADLEWDLSAEALGVRDVLHSASALYLVEGASDDGTANRIDLTLTDGRFTDAGQELEPFVYRFEDAPDLQFPFPATRSIPRGQTHLRIENAMSERAAVWVHDYPEIPQRFRPIEFGRVAHRARGGHPEGRGRGDPGLPRSPRALSDSRALSDGSALPIPRTET